MGLVLLGLNHRTAPLSLREQVAYNRTEALEVLRQLRREENVPQALLLSTCNRTELYALARDGESDAERLERAIFERRLRGCAPPDNWLYRQEGPSAVEHFFRVACGLDSMVLGEQQILGQVKTAYELSQEANTVGTVMHRLAARGFRVGKRARTETAIGLGAVSVAFAAVELAMKVFQSLEGRGALVVGAGENGKLLAEHLLARKVKPLIISSRTQANAEALAAEMGGEAVPFERMDEALSRVDIVVTTTGAPHAVILPDMVRKAMQKRHKSMLVFIDVAVPRDVDPAVDDIGNVLRFDMDAIKDIVDQNMARRAREVPKVENLVRSETESFMQWWQKLDASPVIKDLHRAFEAIRQEELARHAKKFHDHDRENLDMFTRSMLRKILMGVTMEIKGYHLDDPEQAERLAALRHVFHLGEDEEDALNFDEENENDRS